MVDDACQVILAGDVLLAHKVIVLGVSTHIQILHRKVHKRLQLPHLPLNPLEALKLNGQHRGWPEVLETLLKSSMIVTVFAKDLVIEFLRLEKSVKTVFQGYDFLFLLHVLRVRVVLHDFVGLRVVVIFNHLRVPLDGHYAFEEEAAHRLVCRRDDAATALLDPFALRAAVA